MRGQFAGSAPQDRTAVPPRRLRRGRNPALPGLAPLSSSCRRPCAPSGASLTSSMPSPAAASSRPLSAGNPAERGNHAAPLRLSRRGRRPDRTGAFPASDRAFRRAGLDYLDHVPLTRHASWRAFDQWRATNRRRLVLLSTRGGTSYLDFAFQPGDIIMVGRESAGVPDEVFRAADAALRIPMRANCAPSTSRWRRPWFWGKLCARRMDSPGAARRHCDD